MFILHHFVDQRDQVFWGFCRCSKPENHFAILIEKMKQIQDTKATPTVSIREVRINLKNLSATSCIEKWRLIKSHSSSHFRLELIFGNIEVTTNKSRKRITGSSERQTFSEINWDWFLRFKHISRSFSFLKSSWVIISQLTVFQYQQKMHSLGAFDPWFNSMLTGIWYVRVQ